MDEAAGTPVEVELANTGIGAILSSTLKETAVDDVLAGQAAAYVDNHMLLQQIVATRGLLVEQPDAIAHLDSAITEVVNNDPSLQLAQAIGTVSTFRALFPPILGPSAEAPVGDEPTQPEIFDDRLPITIQMEDGRGYLTLGEERIPLSRVLHENQTDYGPARLAALQVMARAGEGSWVPVKDLTSVVSGLTAVSNKDAMFQVGRLFGKLCDADGRPLISHNKMRGPSSAYRLNKAIVLVPGEGTTVDDAIGDLAQTGGKKPVLAEEPIATMKALTEDQKGVIRDVLQEAVAALEEAGRITPTIKGDFVRQVVARDIAEAAIKQGLIKSADAESYSLSEVLLIILGADNRTRQCLMDQGRSPDIETIVSRRVVEALLSQ